MFGRAGMDMFADLGGQAVLVTSVSDDAVGRFCLNRLRDYGVNTAGTVFAAEPSRTVTLHAFERARAAGLRGRHAHPALWKPQPAHFRQ